MSYLSECRSLLNSINQDFEIQQTLEMINKLENYKLLIELNVGKIGYINNEYVIKVSKESDTAKSIKISFEELKTLFSDEQLAKYLIDLVADIKNES